MISGPKNTEVSTCVFHDSVYVGTHTRLMTFTRTQYYDTNASICQNGQREKAKVVKKQAHQKNECSVYLKSVSVWSSDI